MRILLFHGVVPDHYLNRASPKHITESRFREVLDTLDDVFACKDIDIDNLPTGTAITFDDGYLNNYTLAWNILREYGFPWTIFLTTGFIGTDRMIWTDSLERLLWSDIPVQMKFDHIRAWHKGYRELPPQSGDPMLTSFMNWDQVREMNKDPMVDFGAHTVNHVSLGQIRCPRAEINNSLWDITRELGERPTLFAYPEGQEKDIPDDKIMRDCDLDFAFTAMKDWVRPSPYWLPREMIC